MRIDRLALVFGPLLVGLALTFAKRCWSTPAAAPVAASTPSLPLPVPTVAHEPRAGTRYRVADDSHVAFVSTSPFRSLRAITPSVTGTLEFDDAGGASTLDLQVDLSRLVPSTGDGDLDDDLHHLLGQSADDMLQYRGHLVQTTTTAQAGLQGSHWAGRVQLGAKSQRLALDLWIVTLQAGAVYLQGTATLDATELSLPRRYFLGVLPERNRITIGLDLQFCPERH